MAPSTCVTLEGQESTKEEKRDYKKHRYIILLLLTLMTKHVVVRRPMILPRDFNSTISIPQATVKHRVEVTDDSCESSSLKHIQDPIDALRRPLRGGILKGGRAGDRRTRRSKRGDHGLATRHLVRRWNQGSWAVMNERSWQQPQIS